MRKCRFYIMLLFFTIFCIVSIGMASALIPTNFVAKFSTNVSSGYTPLAVQFKDLSENADSWNWDFGDGNTAAIKDPEHIYLRPGNYTVKLTVTKGYNNTETDTLVFSNSTTCNITVLEQPVVVPPDANFICNVTEGNAPLSVKFTDLSKNAASWSWDFGDRATSNQKNPIHTYSSAGNYTVNLTVSNANFKNSTSSTILVLNQSTHPVYAYIANSDNSTIYVIDTSNDTIVKNINISENTDRFPIAIAVNPTGTKVYVSSWHTNDVTVIDTATNNVTAIVPIETVPFGIAVNPSGTKVYVANWGDTVSVIDTSTNTITANVTVGLLPSVLAVSPDGTKVYVANNGDSTVSVIDTATNTVLFTLPVGNWAYAIAVSPDGTKVYMTNFGEDVYGRGYVSVIDTATNKVISNVTVGRYPQGITVNPQGTKVYVTNCNDGSVTVINTTTNTVEAVVNVGGEPTDVSFTPDGNKAYVLNANKSGSFSVIDTATNKIITTVFIGRFLNANGQFIVPPPTQPPIFPVANFSSIKSGNSPFSYQFIDFSKSATVWNWNFGDGNNSTEKSPTHIYHKEGNYNVTLTVANANGTNSTSATIRVNWIVSLPVADFSTNVTEGYAPLDVQFTDLSQNATHLEWNFGDGSSNTSVANPEHIFTSSGLFNVVLTASSGNGSDSKSMTINASSSPAQPVLPVANFSAFPTTGTAPLVIQFVDNALGQPIAWNWDFGDGNYSTEQNPTHTYSSAGNYTVNMTISNVNGTNSTFTNIIVLEQAVVVLPVANFSSNVTSGYVPLSVQFNDSSENATVWSWDFGDGDNSTEKNPTHTFSGVGNYTVRLNVTNENSVASRDAIITVLPLPPVYGKQNAYIANYGSNTVSVIDTKTKTFVATVPVGQGPSGVAVIPDGTKVYVTDSGSNNVSVIDTATNRVIATVDVGSGPYGVAVCPDGNKVYVTNLYNNNISVIDTATNRVVASVPVGSWPEGVAFTPDGKRAYVANYYSYNTISVIDTATNTVTATVDNPEINGPSGIAVTQDGKKAYVTSNFNDKVFVIDTATNQVIATVDAGKGPHGDAVSPDGKMVYVVNGEGNTVSIIDTATNQVIATVDVGSEPYGISVTPDGKMVYVTNYRSNDISVIDAATNQVIATVPVENNPKSFGQFIGSFPILPVAKFNSNVTMGRTPLSVQFADLSENAISWKWEFGDGAASTDENPLHTYSAAGNYIVTLTVNNSAGSDVVTKHDYIVASKQEDTIIWGVAPLSLQFTDKSENAASWKWYFGDGTNSTEQNPKHTYTKAGQYAVTLVVNNVAGSNTATYTGYINVVNFLEPPVAAFSASPTYGKMPLNVSFAENSTGTPTSWKWYFGDGTNSTEQNPTHIYTKAGQFAVTLSVSNVAGSNSITKLNYISVGNSFKAPITAFSVSVTS